MKRSSMPRRSTPLARSGFSSTPPATRKSPNARRRATSGAERIARAAVKARSQGVCEGCGQAPATDWSHRIGAGVGGPWCPSNGLHLCRSDHEWLHAYPTRARDELGWRLRSTDDPLSFPVLHAVHGWVLLDVDGGFRPAAPPADLAA